MGKKLVAVVAAVLVLAGCTAAPSDDGTEAPDSSSQRSAPEETSAPAEPEFTEAELEFLEWMKSETVAPNVVGKSQEELVAAAWAACKMFDEGIAYGQMELIEGGDENRADNDIASLASQLLCTEHDITLGN